MEQQYISSKQAAMILGVTDQTIKKYIHRGEIESKRIGRSLFVPKNFMQSAKSGRRIEK